MTEAPAPRRSRLRRRLLVWGLPALLLLGGGYWWTLGKGRYLFFPKRWGVVEEGLLYRSGQIHRRLIEDELEDHGIKVIVDLSPDKPGDPDEEAEARVAKEMGVRKVNVMGLNGYGTGDLEGYVQTVTEMAKAEKTKTPLLVHCASGAQRTGGAVGYFRVLVEGWSGKKAYDEMMEYRHEPHGKDRLVDFMNANMEDVARGLVKNGVIEKVPEPLPKIGP